MRKLSTSIILILFSTFVFSQDNNNESSIKVGILPVTSTNTAYDSYTTTVQASITKSFAEKSRFTVVDRTKMDEVAKEKKLQKQEDFINSTFIAEQGKSIGAQYLVSANIMSITSKWVKIAKTDYFSKPIREYTVQGIQVYVQLNVQILEVATGSIKSNKTYTDGGTYESSNEDAIIGAVAGGFGGYFKSWINEVFPIQMKIIRIESKSRKGLPETVLIKGGAEMDLSVSKGFLSNNSSELEVYYNEVLTVDGKDMTRKIVIGKVRIDENQGEFSVCKVKSGAEEIQKKMDEGKTLYLKISHY